MYRIVRRVYNVFISSHRRKGVNGKLKLFLHITDADFLRDIIRYRGRKFRARTFRSLRESIWIYDIR